MPGEAALCSCPGRGRCLIVPSAAFSDLRCLDRQYCHWQHAVSSLAGAFACPSLHPSNQPSMCLSAVSGSAGLPGAAAAAHRQGGQSWRMPPLQAACTVTGGLQSGCPASAYRCFTEADPCLILKLALPSGFVLLATNSPWHLLVLPTWMGHCSAQPAAAHTTLTQHCWVAHRFASSSNPWLCPCPVGPRRGHPGWRAEGPAGL